MLIVHSPREVGAKGRENAVARPLSCRPGRRMGRCWLGVRSAESWRWLRRPLTSGRRGAESHVSVFYACIHVIRLVCNRFSCQKSKLPRLLAGFCDRGEYPRLKLASIVSVYVCLSLTLSVSVSLSLSVSVSLFRCLSVYLSLSLSTTLSPYDVIP